VRDSTIKSADDQGHRSFSVGTPTSVERTFAQASALCEQEGSSPPLRVRPVGGASLQQSRLRDLFPFRSPWSPVGRG
jgi:hypothetical protein